MQTLADLEEHIWSKALYDDDTTETSEMVAAASEMVAKVSRVLDEVKARDGSVADALKAVSSTMADVVAAMSAIRTDLATMKSGHDAGSTIVSDMARDVSQGMDRVSKAILDQGKSTVAAIRSLPAPAAPNVRVPDVVIPPFPAPVVSVDLKQVVDAIERQGKAMAASFDRLSSRMAAVEGALAASRELVFDDFGNVTGVKISEDNR